MTSMLPEENTKITMMKGKLNDVHGKEEARSFLSFSRENLSISQSELEQGFNKYRFRPNRNTILSIAALSIALLCLGLESWKFHWSLVNAREIEELKRSVENLKNRFLGKDLLDKMKAFEEQLNAEESDDYVEAEIGNADYDSNYEEDLSIHDYALDYHTPPTYGARPSDFPDSPSTIAPVPSPPEANKAVMKLVKFEIKQDSKKNSRESHRKIDRHQEDRMKVLEKKSEDQKNSTKEKREVDRVKNLLVDWKASLKRKRSIEKDASRELIIDRNRTSNIREKSRDKTGSKDQVQTVTPKRSHPPKKYNTRSSQDAFSLRLKDNSAVRNFTNQPKRSSRRLRKSLHEPQIFAVHYGGNKDSCAKKDVHTGNGRIRHAGKVFTSWKADDWVKDLGMDEHFNLLTNGSVIVYKSGLYLAYAQIHYKDAHNELGFHLVVNDEPILQCVIDNSGRTRPTKSGEINMEELGSQSCFSAQVTMLKRDDIVALKEIGSPKFALFNAENSFFGLMKLGEFPHLKRSV